MPKINAYEKEILGTFEKGRLKSVASKAELARLKSAARATGKRSKHRKPVIPDR